MKCTPTFFPDVLLIEPTLFKDDRGTFIETYQAERYKKIGIHLPFVQDNFSHSKKNVVRGLHYQFPHLQGKLVWVTRGEVIDVVVDIRLGSPTFGKHITVVLNDTSRQQLYIPPGFAHGFCTLSDEVDFFYKCTDYYHPESEKGILWNDPRLTIPWPITEAELSPKDQQFPPLDQIPQKNLPLFEKLK